MLQDVTVSKNSTQILLIPLVKGGMSRVMYFWLARLANVTCHPCNIVSK